jgi:hypothetical protein
VVRRIPDGAGCALVLLVALFRSPSLQAVALALMGAALLVAISVMRLFVTRLQDRIIRVEMHQRLTRAGRDVAVHRLSIGQLVALRFASDAELPALVDRTLAEHLSGDAIKRAVTEWQADLLRV